MAAMALRVISYSSDDSASTTVGAVLTGKFGLAAEADGFWSWTVAWGFGAAVGAGVTLAVSFFG